MTFTVRRASRENHAQIAACFTETRGPSYYGPETYSASWLEENCELFAAFDGSGELAGVAGLSQGLFNDERTTGCLLTVRPGFAGNGVAKLLIAHFIGVLRERGAKAVKGQVVTGHTAVQDIVEGFGWTPTGFLYGAREGKNAKPTAEGKNALVLYTGNLSARDAGKLYIHKGLSGAARRMYERLGVQADFCENGGRGETDLFHVYDAHNRALYIRAAECGADLAAALDDVRRRHEDAAVTVVLDLGVPSAIAGVELLRGAGYRFCGFDPLGQREAAVFYSGEIPGRMKLTANAETIRCEVDSI